VRATGRDHELRDVGTGVSLLLRAEFSPAEAVRYYAAFADMMLGEAALDASALALPPRAPVGEGAQVGLVIGVDGGGLVVVEAVAVQAGEDLGELGDVAGVRFEVRQCSRAGRVSPFPRRRGCLVGKDPAGQVAGLGGPGDGGGAARAAGRRGRWRRSSGSS
jgi:hypothetical protein